MVLRLVLRMVLRVRGGLARVGRSLEYAELLLGVLDELAERLAFVEGELDERTDVLGLQWPAQFLIELLEHLGDAREIERDIVLQHEQVEVEGDERTLTL